MASSKQCPIWIKEKEIQKKKKQTEKRIAYPEANKIVNMYSIPNYHFESTLKAP